MKQAQILDWETGPAYFALKIDIGCALASTVRVRGYGFVAKDDFHVTLVGRGHRFAERLAAVRGCSVEEAAALEQGLFLEAAVEFDFRVNLKSDYSIIEKKYREPRPHVRRSVVTTCAVTWSQEFYRRLAELSGVSLTGTPHHVTLFVINTELGRQGIGLTSTTEFCAHAQAVDNPDHRKQLPVF